MMKRQADGSAGDTNYSAIGGSYANFRQPEPAITAIINRALGSAQSVLNVGAGAGSYEPLGRRVTAVEPSSSMRSQLAQNLGPAIDAVAEDLPFPDNHFDATMTTFSVHQWTRLDDGLKEMRRVTRGPVIVLSCDPDLVERFWLHGISTLDTFGIAVENAKAIAARLPETWWLIVLARINIDRFCGIDRHQAKPRRQENQNPSHKKSS